MHYRLPKSRRRAGRGFTLIELLLVLVILGTLAAIVVPKFTGRGEEAKIAAAKTTMKSFDVALDVFESDNDYYPSSSEGLEALIEPPAETANWKGPYLKGEQEIPNDPWGVPYIYEFPGKKNVRGYDLMSCGPDKKAGTEDDITNWARTK